MLKIDVNAIPPEPAGEMPPEFQAAAVGRIWRNVSADGGLTDFVANHEIIAPGSWSAQRHWHEGEDELVVVLSGAATLVDDDGRHPLAAGEIAVFPKGDRNAHHLVNESDAPVVVLALSLPEASPVHYPDINKRWAPGEAVCDDHPV